MRRGAMMMFVTMMVVMVMAMAMMSTREKERACDIHGQADRGADEYRCDARA